VRLGVRRRLQLVQSQDFEAGLAQDPDQVSVAEVEGDALVVADPLDPPEPAELRPSELLGARAPRPASRA
jgi:hypothetical protein